MGWGNFLLGSMLPPPKCLPFLSFMLVPEGSVKARLSSQWGYHGKTHTTCCL